MSDEQVSLEEVVVAGYKDPLFFGKTFFPRTFKQESPECHEEVINLMVRRSKRKKIAKMFRGGAKTSLARVIAAHRISYAYSNVILVLSKAQDHAIRSIQWIQYNVEHNTEWARTFGLSKAMNKATGRPQKWTDEWITIYNSVEDKNIHVLAYGITGQVRGVNINDDRPDFVIGDDIIDDDNASTEEQREKIKERLYGTVYKSLVPSSENPDACMLLLQTPIHKEDAVEEAMGEPDWDTISISVFDENNMSRWESRLPTAELHEEKASYIRKNKLSVWNREMEVKVTSGELKLFIPSWLQLYDTDPGGGFIILSVDPTPPPKNDKENQDVEKLDDAVVMVTRFCKGGFFVLEYYTTKSPKTLELCAKILEMYKIYRPSFVAVETFLFQRTIKEILEVAAVRESLFFQVIPIEDKRNKFVRIKDTVSDRAYHSKIHVKPTMTEFISQFDDYPLVKHDDLLDALSIAILALPPALLEQEEFLTAEYRVLEEDEEEDYDDDYIEAAP